MSGIKAASDSGPPPYTRPDASAASFVFGVFNSLGGVAFTFGGQAVLPEIQVWPVCGAGTALPHMHPSLRCCPGFQVRREGWPGTACAACVLAACSVRVWTWLLLCPRVASIPPASMAIPLDELRTYLWGPGSAA